MSVVSTYLFVLLAYPFIQNLTTLLHELGHALPALWLTDSERVEVYINAYGKKEGAYRYKAGRLFFYWHPLRFKGYGSGLTEYYRSPPYIWNYVITAGGVVFSLLIAGVVLLLVLYSRLPEAWQILAIVLFAATVVDLVMNLIPNGKGVALDDGRVVPNDGKQLQQLWRYHRVYTVIEKVAARMAAGQEAAAEKALQGLPIGRADAEELRLLLQHTAATGFLAEASFWDAAFERLQSLESLSAMDRMNWGVILGRRGQYAAALDCFEQLPGDEPWLRANRAFVLLEMGQTAKAAPLFERLAAEEETSYNLAHYGLCLARLDERQLGWENIEKALTLSEAEPYALRCAGLYYLETGQLQRALDYFQQISEAQERIPRLAALLQSANQSDDS
ncbi:MAG: hypothetical protein GVY26_20205 [Bacteroidetes bacterium]|jgi:tetratricopeptide (TPR) repeat protein|nr:hypothetical protein [Bacteroidota bacterium]